MTQRARVPLALAGPAALAVGLVLLPLVYLVVRASEGGERAWRVLVRESTLDLVLQTVALVGGVTAAAIAVGVPLAWLVVRTDLPVHRVIGIAAALPLVVPSYVAALALLGAFGPKGLLQELLEGPFGVERLPAIYGYPGALAALTLATYPYVYLLAAAALRGLDASLEEAARGLGESGAGVFRRVTLPALRPAVGAGGLLVALYTLSDFGVVSLMQYDALTRSIFTQYRSLFDRTPAAVLGLVLVALTAIVLGLEARSRRGAFHRTAVTRQPARVRLGRWRWPAFAFCSVVVALFLLLPIAVLAYWAARAASFELAWSAGGRSLLASALAAAAAVLLVLPIAVLTHRHGRWWTRALERMSYAGNALPGIVIALSLVFFAANYTPFVYQTLGLLVVAYVVRFLPQALAGVSSALRAVSPRVEEAARGLGRGPWGVLVSVTVPLVRPGMLAGAALVFLSAMKELPATLLLRPIGYDTLATEVWKFTSLGSYSRAAAPALLLIVLSAPLVYLLTVRQGEPGLE